MSSGARLAVGDGMGAARDLRPNECAGVAIEALRGDDERPAACLVERNALRGARVERYAQNAGRARLAAGQRVAQ